MYLVNISMNSYGKDQLYKNMQNSSCFVFFYEKWPHWRLKVSQFYCSWYQRVNQSTSFMLPVTEWLIALYLHYYVIYPHHMVLFKAAGKQYFLWNLIRIPFRYLCLISLDMTTWQRKLRYVKKYVMKRLTSVSLWRIPIAWLIFETT